ncbi:MAG TPA: DNA polymerase IV [Gemmatimonadaceae bacterium]|nr:DNA polymerase IV [Gemmatimonadaceae bacterium]
MPNVLLADADAFFVAVARLVDPEGAGRAPLLIVGGSADSRGVVCSASYETRAFGVRSAMPVSQALRLCPRAMCVPVPRRECSVKSHQIRAILYRFAPVVETASIDEWYLNLTGTEALYGGEPIERTAERIRDAVREGSGLTVSIGGGTNKLVAKLAVEVAKPKPGTGRTGVHIVPDGTESEFLTRFTLGEIPLVGPRFQERLKRHGMVTVRDVLAHDERTLVTWLGKRDARWLLDRVHGVDHGKVAGDGELKSLSREDTFAVDIGDDASLERELLRLVVRAAADLRAEGLTTRTVTVKLRDFDFSTRQASRTLDDGVMSDRPIHETARALLRRLRSARRCKARLLGVSLSSLAAAPAPSQLAFFEAPAGPLTETARDRTIAHTVDALRERFGDDAIGPGALARRARPAPDARKPG